jgi:outer membrane protein assembly factor BamB
MKTGVSTQKFTTLVIGLALAVLLVLTGCGGDSPTASSDAPERQEPPADAPPESTTTAVGTTIEEEETDTISVPQLDHAMITFVTGDAWLARDGEEFLADIGDYLQPEEELRVETGYAELQAGTLGSIRVRENSVIRLDDIVLDPAGQSLDLRVVSGSVLNKVNRLAGNESYEVRTETAVMGVRGTEFGVDVNTSTGTRVAVRVGRVAVVPPAADPQRLREQAAAAGEAAEVVEAAIQRLEAEAPVFAANEEASFDEASATAGEEAVEEIETIIAEVTTQASRGEAIDREAVSRRAEEAAVRSAERVGVTVEEKRRAVSADARQQLEEIDRIRAVPVTAAETSVLVPVRLIAQPGDSEIRLDGQLVGTGRFSGVFSPGERLSFVVSHPTRGEEQLDVTVGADRGRTYRVSLAERAPASDEENDPESEPAVDTDGDADTGPESNTVDNPPLPEQARRTDAGNPSDAVTQSGSAPAGPEATAPPRRAAEPPPRREEPPVPTPEPEPEPDPQPTTAILSVAVSPSDANLVIDGRRAPSARTEREFQIGTTVTVAASRPGYASAERTITISAEGSAVELRLEARPLEASVEVAPGPLVRGLASDGIRGYAADRAGTVYAIDPSGRVLWSVATANGGNENSAPAVTAGNIAFSGAAERVVLNATDGRVLSRESLAGSGSHLFGRRAVPWGNRLLFPSDEEIAILDVQGNPTGRTIPIPGGSKMTPAVVAGVIAIADQQGQVLLIDPESGTLRSSVPTGMSQPVALAPATDGTRVFIVGRRGVAAAVDAAAARLLWEQPLPGGRGSFVDPVVAGPVVLFFDGSEIVGLSTANGSVRFRLESAAGPPNVAGGMIYYASSSGELRRVNPGSGIVTGRVPLPGAAAGGPTAIGDRLLVPLADGRVVTVHTAGIQ